MKRSWRLFVPSSESGNIKGWWYEASVNLVTAFDALVLARKDGSFEVAVYDKDGDPMNETAKFDSFDQAKIYAEVLSRLEEGQ